MVHDRTRPGGKVILSTGDANLARSVDSIPMADLARIIST
jgi:hypothetical protein